MYPTPRDKFKFLTEVIGLVAAGITLAATLIDANTKVAITQPKATKQVVIVRQVRSRPLLSAVQRLLFS
jgi:hypothetical protein